MGYLSVHESNSQIINFPFINISNKVYENPYRAEVFLSVIAVTGLKGGFGKTTLTANLAVEMNALGHKVSVLDTDPQKSLLQWAQSGKGILSRVVNFVNLEDQEIFKEKINSESNHSDRILIDTPPGFAKPALLAASIADVVLLPVSPSPLDIMATIDALNHMKKIRDQRVDQKPVFRIVPYKVQSGTRIGQDVIKMLGELGVDVFSPIGLRVTIIESAYKGLTVREWAPHSKAAEEFKALALEVEILFGH